MEEENKTDVKVETTENTQEDKQDNTTFTRSDVDREVSKAVQSAIDKREAKHKEELQQAIKEAIEEKERLSKLSEKEKKEEELSKREQEIADRLAEIERKELKADAVSDLTEKGLPTEFADVLLADTAENTLNNINMFKEQFDIAVNEAVKEKLKGTSPKRQQVTNTGVTKQEILSIKDGAERIKAIQENPHLFN